jgi:hypothetical protein
MKNLLKKYWFDLFLLLTVVMAVIAFTCCSSTNDNQDDDFINYGTIKIELGKTETIARIDNHNMWVRFERIYEGSAQIYWPGIDGNENCAGMREGLDYYLIFYAKYQFHVVLTLLNEKYCVIQITERTM